MLKLQAIDILIIGIPEVLIYIFALYSFSKKKINLHDYVLSICMLGFGSYITRLLPIAFGIHTILDILILIVISILVLKVSIIKAISYSLISTLILSSCEMVTIFIYVSILKIDIQTKFSNPITKDLYGLPSEILFFIFIFLIREFLKRKTNKITKIQ